MTMRERRYLLSRGSLVLSLAAGCAEPCIDDGLGQGAPTNCAAADAGGTTDEPEPTTTTDPMVDETAEPPGCDNGIQDGDETDVDCGGSCSDNCGGGQGCENDDDCDSDQCAMGMTCEDPRCTDGMTNGDETDVDCGGGTCPPCDDGEDCLEDSDCMSQLCDLEGTSTCLSPTCDDGVVNGGETDLDCGGPCGPTCDPGEDCLVGEDCVYHGCDPGGLVCNDLLTVDAEPVCSDHMGMPVPLTATAAGGSGMYTYAWTPDDGSLSAPDQAMTDADPPTGFANYSVMVDDGFAMASDDVLVVSQSAYDLQNDCTLYLADLSMGSGPAAPVYDMGGTRECETTGNNDFAMHLCEGTSLYGVRLRGTVGVTDAHADGDEIGLVWGAQDASNFYVLAWKGEAQTAFGCDIPVGITVKRIGAPMFSDLGGDDLFCPNDTADSTLLFDPTGTTTQPWVAGESYEITIDFTAAGSAVAVERESDGFVVANFMVADNTFTSGYFGSLTYSQHDACTGPLLVSCL